MNLTLILLGGGEGEEEKQDYWYNKTFLKLTNVEIGKGSAFLLMFPSLKNSLGFHPKPLKINVILPLNVLIIQLVDSPVLLFFLLSFVVFLGLSFT